MPDDLNCEALREPIAELALGIASGEQRARVLEHASRCPSCRRLLSELALVDDELLALAPEHEPPPGFEVRVLARLGRPRRRGRRNLAVAAVAAALAAAALAAAAVLVATGDERRLGAQLQAVLSRADGQYLAVTELRDRTGRELGLVFHYGGRPSWVFVTLERPLPPGRYAATLVTAVGTTSELGTFALGPGDRSLGAATRMDLRQATLLRLREERGGPTYEARFR
jgi:predicted anti-sigma-YlaC factor YlaD